MEFALMPASCEGQAGARLMPVGGLHEEAVRVVPRQEDVLEHLLHTSLLEAQVLSTHDGRVDEVEA